MKNLYIKDLKADDSLFGALFALKGFQKISKGTTNYIDLVLADNTGEIKAKVWSDSISQVEAVKEGDIVSVNGTVQDHPKFGMQLILTEVLLAKDYDSADFIPVSSYDLSAMEADLKNYISKIKNKHLQKLINNVFDEDFYKIYVVSPAAYYIHHAYKSGLLEHTLDMLKMSEGIKDRYPKINYDLLLTGIIFHDLGKCFEYSLGSSIGMTKKGKLLGHIFLGAEYVKAHAPKDMPEDLLEEVLHMILAHQGELEFGSPIKPKTTEAVALYFLDNASTRINAAYNVIHNLDETAEFAPYHKQLGVELYRSPYLDELVNEDLPF